MFIMSFLFFGIALLYSIVGFGGGSSYIAILATFDVPYETIPKLSLLCNIIVVSGGCWHFYKGGHIDQKLAFPFVLSSVPFAFIGGSFPLTEKTFFYLLTISLLLCGLRILFIRIKEADEIKRPGAFTSSFVGAGLGFLSGMVGIGGGIFLSPILINLGWARSKSSAAIASVFIFLNSIAGLLGQLSKGEGLPAANLYLPLFVAVIIGGQIGSRVGSHPKMPYSFVQMGTGLLVMFVGLRLLIQNLAA